MALYCKEIFQQVTILANGQVVCSCIDSEGLYPFGNVFDTPIYDIFMGQKYQEVRRWLINTTDSPYCPLFNMNCFMKCLNSKDTPPQKDVKIQTLQLEITSHCNLECTDCNLTKWKKTVKEKGVYEVKGKSRFAVMPFEKIKEIIDDVKNDIKKLDLYNYGEPFLHPDIISVLRYARKAMPNVYIYIHTNGSYLPKEYRKAILEEGLINNISFSVDGVNQESYAAYREGGDFNKVYNNMIDLATERNNLGLKIPKVTWQYILFKSNDKPEYIQKVKDVCKDLKLENLFVITNTQSGSTKYYDDPNALDNNINLSSGLKAKNVKPTQKYSYLKDKIKRQYMMRVGKIKNIIKKILTPQK